VPAAAFEETVRMQAKVLNVVSEVLGVPVDDLTDDSSPESIESWDSLKHMNLVLALEEEFGIRFSDEQIVAMLSVRSIKDAVAELAPDART
jgi:acyl carrier protein